MSDPIDRGSSCAELENAALYVAGALAVAERAAFAVHVERCAECRAELDLHASTVAELDLVQVQDDLAHGRGVEARGSLRDALVSSLGAPLDRKWQRWSKTSGETIAPGLVNVPNSDEGWEAIGIPGIDVKQLSVDAESRKATMMIRMAPGTSYPRHRHAAREECFVLQGELRVGDKQLRTGDFQVADRDSIHDVQSTETGCVLLIVSSQDDELV